MDVDQDEIGWGPYLRVKVWVDIIKPLLRGSMINIAGAPTWIPFEYERFPNFIFRRGMIKHASSGCSKGLIVNKMHDSDNCQYGAWLRALASKVTCDTKFGEKNSLWFIVF